MGQRIRAEELREMLRLARKLRISAETADDDSYRDLFLRGAAALELRAAELAYHPGDLERVETDIDETEGPDPWLYRRVDLLC
jgi:hypothetical protein